MNECPLCHGAKHRKEKRGEGQSAEWVYVPCQCILKERLRAYLGLFATAVRIESSPLLQFVTESIFCGPITVEEAKKHIAWVLRKQGLSFRYKLVDVAQLGALYMSEGTTDGELYQHLDLLIIMLNLVSIRSQKADDLVSRALVWRQLVGKPVWVFAPGNFGALEKEFPQSARHLSGVKKFTLLDPNLQSGSSKYGDYFNK